MGFLFVLSLALSAVYYAQSWKGPITSVYKWENSDMAFFDTWAKHIAAGDWLVDTMLHPYHAWHSDLAVEYFKQYPEIEAKYVAQTDSLSTVIARRALINDIYKGKTYHQEPLYAYMLAVTYKLFGIDHQWVFFWQFLLAAFTSVLLYLVGKQFFNPLTGLIASLFVTLCGSIMVFQMVLIRTTMTNFFTVLLLYLFLKVLEAPTMKRQLIFGVASGIALLGQSYLILFLVPVWGYFLWMQRKNLREVVPAFAAGIGALLLVMMPLFIRNIKVGVPVTAMASQGAMAYIPMNIQESYPMESFFVHMPSLVKIRHETGGKMLRAVGECLNTFDSFERFWKVYKQKINGMFMWYEIPNNMNYYLFREIAPFLKILPVHYFFIAPLGLAGLLLGIWIYRKKILPLVLLTIVSMAPMMIAGDLARYRTPLVIMLSIFAAYFLIEVITQLREKNFKVALSAIGISVLAFLYTSTAVDNKTFVYIGSDFDTFYRNHYQDLLTTYEAAGDYDNYLKMTTEMVDNLPDYFLEVPLEKKITKGNEAICSRYVANFLESHFNILTYLKRTQEAAFFQDRIRILRARMDDFNLRAGLQK